ncbi:hypothetical protein ATO6_18910 [Oceanicola sp. 22II-s10i]|uniref:GntR family transcriptional regulator n=1 Tax=Oceanicola sp. 22II-s10i TaxID=1317116 RepID=UPI000B6E20C4|nr:GntR family transcriptional regulator [Oceanicola sp. 22II-s10i]OWU83495.1 hypothetical protein ATO6_18910 [Oceanicola sp. 22II-s10i]
MRDDKDVVTKIVVGQAGRTRGEEVAEAIRNGIAEGRLAGGGRLNENELATMLGVSRTPVRSALATLAADGLLDYTPNSGYTVRRFTSGDIEDIFKVRVKLEGLAAGLAAQNGLSDAALGGMHRLMGETERLIDTHSWNAEIHNTWVDLNNQFHDHIYEAADNPYLIQTIRRANLSLFSLVRFHWFDNVLLRQSHEEHIELVDALENRDVQRAEFLQGEHVYRSGRRIVARWRRMEAMDGEKRISEAGGGRAGK